LFLFLFFSSLSLLHTYHHFKGKDTSFYFILVPDYDVYISCEPSNITRSLRGLPYSKLDVFIQSCLDAGNELQLCDVVDGTDLPEEWGGKNLDFEGDQRRRVGSRHEQTRTRICEW
jgi:hypothetical protein